MLTFPSEHAVRWGGCLPFDRKISQGFPKHNGKQFISLPQILTLVTISSHLMTNEDQGCQHVAIKSRIKLKNLVLNTKGQNIFKNVV